MKKYIILFLVSILTGCSNIKFKFDHKPCNINLQSDPTLIKLNAIGNDKNIIFFLNGFERDTIEIINENEILFKKAIKTGSNTGLAKYQVVTNKSNVIIRILSIKSEILLKKQKLKEFKCVYISKKDNQSMVEYSNTFKSFL